MGDIDQLEFARNVQIDDNDALTNAPRAKFGVPDAAIAEIQKLLGSAEVAPWYRRWRIVRAEAKSLPAAYRTAGLTEAEWQQVVVVEQSRRDIRARYAKMRAEEAAK